MNGSKNLMNAKIQRLLDDVDKVSYLILTVQNELVRFAHTAHWDDRMAHLKERMDEIRTRLEGVREFLCAAQELRTGSLTRKKSICGCEGLSFSGILAGFWRESL